ncbi:MAG: hypothetical protein AMXMBFR47_13670 [Planctomycetota bacterium]
MTRHDRTQRDRDRGGRRGLILPVVLVLIGLLALTMAGFVFFVRAETAGIRAASDGQQARLCTESAFEEIVAYLRQFRDNPGEWFDRPDRFRHVLVWGEGFDRQNDPIKDSRSRSAYFESTPNPTPAFRYSLVAAREGGPEGSMRFGITPESGKLNLNTASDRQIRELVTPLLAEMGLQNAPEIVDAILDWRDGDNTARELGAENEYYNTLTPPYNAKNTRFDTVEELLLVKGVTSAILWGEDVNRNGILDPNEDDGDASFPVYDNGDGTLNVGIAPYLTVHAREVDTALDNAPRFNLAMGQALAAQIATKFQENELSPETIAFLIGLQGMGINPSALRSPADLFPPGPDDTFESVFGNPDAEADTVQSVEEKAEGSFNTSPTDEEQKRQSEQEQSGTGGKDESRSQVKDDPQPPANPGSGGGGNRGGRGNRGGGGRNTGGAGGNAGGQTGDAGGQDAGAQEGGRNSRGGRGGGGMTPVTRDGAGGRAGRGGRGGASSQPSASMTAQMFEALRQSPITPAEMPYIMDRFTTRSPQQQSRPIEGLININTAPARVLALIPNITPEAIQGIIQGRQTVPAESRLTTAWPLTAGVVDSATFKRIAPYITTKCYQFHVEALGYADHLKTVKRYEWIVEMVGPMPQVKYFRDLTGLGMAWPIDSESAVVTEE